VAGITSCAGTVYVGGNALVSVVNLGLGMTGVIRADKGRVVRRIRMASRAHTARVTVIHAPETVSKRRSQPIRRGVARRAGGGGDTDDSCIGGEVIWHVPAQRRRALPLSGVATVAIGRRHGRTGVAKIAGHGDVRAGQRETGRVVIEDRAQPRGRGVARRAGGGITGCDVIWYGPAEGRGALPGSRVATVAIGGQRAAVIAIHMAQRAGYGGVRAGQGERCGGVIESRGRPIRSGMADRTVCRKPGRNMIRHRAAQGRRALPGSQMAAVAGC